jgi:uncharacterized membrane protein YbhN (UPF0104 family)
MEVGVIETETASLVPGAPRGEAEGALPSTSTEASTRWMRRFRHLLRWAPALLFALALFVVQRELKDREFIELAHTWRHVPWHLIAAAILLTIVNYGILAGYDFLALRFTGHRVPLSRMLLASFIGYGISNNTGHSWASGGSVRYRFYADAGVPGRDVAKMSLFLALTYIVGVLTLGFAGTALAPGAERDALGHTGIFDLMLGGSLVALLA